MNQTIPDKAKQVLDFWLAAGPEKWFAKNPDFDAEFRELFYDLHFQAAAGELSSWLVSAESAPALLILLDQYPRNAFRGTAHMFATDGLALHYARTALQHIEKVPQALRNFVCLPFMHAELLEVQEQSLALYQQHMPDSTHWAQEHRDIIARFGRFPHRNKLLGRLSTKQEQEFLDSGGFAG